MFKTSINIDEVVSHALSMRGVIFIVGKLSLFAAVGFAYAMGDNIREASQQKLPEVDFEVDEENTDVQAKPDFSNYAVIVQRNLFGTRKESKAPKNTVEPVTSLKLRLVGTNLSSSAESFAIIEDTKKKKQDVFDIGSSVFEQAKLVEVLTESVKLERNGKIEILVLEDSKIKTGGGTSESGVASLNEEGTEFEVAEEELNNALANLPRLLSQARAVPYFRNGKSVGMRLFAIRRGSLYEKLGLKNGDIIKEVNDNSLSDPAQALKLFEQLKSERSINVLAERAGKDMDLRYSIR